MKIFAHRGASGDYPENTMLAFKKALKIGVDGMELDVHKCRDGQLVVVHDEDIQRTFKGKGRVADYTLEELKNFKCRKFEFENNDEAKICTLEEVIKLIKNEDIVLNIEAKTDEIHYDLEEDVLDLVNKYDVRDKILVSSFYHKTIENFKILDLDIKYGALYYSEKDYDSEDSIVEHANNIGVYSINISEALVTKEVIKMAHEKGIKVLVYTVNSPISMRKMIDLKVDGVFTDFPELMKEVLQEIK
ncbi:MAG: glycerophosphodiester phosphodiesterase [Paraclostridium sp.]